MNARQNLRKRIRRAEHRLAEFNGVDIGDAEERLVDEAAARPTCGLRDRLRKLEQIIGILELSAKPQTMPFPSPFPGPF